MHSHRLTRFILRLLPVLAACGLAAAQTPVVVSRVETLPFVDRVEALGTLKANESVEVSAKVSDVVAEVHFEDGERVQQGQVLAELQSAEERAQLAEAEARVWEAQRQFDRVRDLEAKGSAPASLLDQRRRELQTARAQVRVIEARLADRSIRAPFAGVLGLRNISPGALVEPGDLITTLDDDRIMKLDFSVPSTYLVTLRPGLLIEARARAYPGQSFTGEIRSVDSRVDPVTRSIQVRALIDNPDRRLKPGVLMQVELLKNPRQAIVIPEAALLQQARLHYVLVVDPGDDNRVLRRELRIGARRPGQVEVLDGLAAGELVITRGAISVRPGQQVAPRGEDGDGGAAGPQP